MKTFLLCLALAGGAAARGDDILHLKVEPEQTRLLAGADREIVVKIDLTSPDAKKTRRNPLNIAVVLDRSGSMAGAKIEKARQAAALVVDQMTSRDTFSLIAFDTQVEVIVPAQRVDDKEAIKSQIERIRPRGSTAIYAAVDRGASELQKHLSGDRINRVLLLSDGLANVGPHTPRELRRLGETLAQRGVSVTTIGLGDDYNEELMSGLAEASDANYYYVRDTEKLPEIFAKELGSLLAVTAREIRIEITCPEGVEPIGLIGRPEKFDARRGIVHLDSLSAGQNRSLLLRCRVAGTSRSGETEVARVNLSYRNELRDGAHGEMRDSARVTFTGNEALAKASINSKITIERELMWNAVRKDEAIAQADAGNYEAAAQKLSAQAASLSISCAAAPVESQPRLRAEVENLRQQSADLQQGRYGAGSRKDLQSQSWNYRNSKSGVQ